MQRRALEWRRRGVRIAFVPTMGYLHEGHLRLADRARRSVGSEGQVVVSIYVNPIQFGLNEDLSRYPRDLSRDLRLCRARGVDAVFAPGDSEIYPKLETHTHSTYVVEEQLAGGMEGAARPTHFRGVTTVVAKLFNLVLPDFAIFGSKDFQQTAVVGRMIRDLNFPVRLIVAPTVREKDGLAMSSRNRYLSVEERRQACVLYRAIRTARRMVRESASGVPGARLCREVAGMIDKQPHARVEYVSVFDPATLLPVRSASRGMQLALAAFVGKTRLIDNGEL
jgi:pantoate--beta-alanine ligase